MRDVQIVDTECLLIPGEGVVPYEAISQVVLGVEGESPTLEVWVDGSIRWVRLKGVEAWLACEHFASRHPKLLARARPEHIHPR